MKSRGECHSGWELPELSTVFLKKIFLLFVLTVWPVIDIIRAAHESMPAANS